MVEDDALLSGIMQKKFINEGFEAKIAIDIYQAEQILKQQDVGVILLDLLLPGAEGFELLTRLKNDPKRKDIPVIVFSNLSDEEDKRRAFRAGAWDFLVKAEHTPETIVQKIKEVLQATLPK